MWQCPVCDYVYREQCKFRENQGINSSDLWLSDVSEYVPITEILFKQGLRPGERQILYTKKFSYNYMYIMSLFYHSYISFSTIFYAEAKRGVTCYSL